MNRRVLGAIVLATLAGWLLPGCDEETRNSVEGGSISTSGNGLVQVSETSERRVVVRYLRPDHLAAAELRSRNGDVSIDSLRALYSGTMSFHIAVADARSEEIGPGAGSDSSLFAGGIVDVEANRDAFRLESGGEVWAPLCAIPESQVGDADRTWFVVFPVDARKDLKDRKFITIRYVPSVEEGESVQFTYAVEDLLRTEIIASTH